MITDFVTEHLHALGALADADSVLDALWLATRLPSGAQRPASHSADLPKPREPEQTSGVPGDTAVTVTLKRLDPQPVKSAPDHKHDGHSRQVWISAVTSINDGVPHPLDVARALRALRHRRPSAAEAELDEAATADLSARAGGETWLPVLRAPLRRWPDIAVIADTRSNLWNRRLTEVNLILRRLGAFRQHREWRLHPPSADSSHAMVVPGFAGASGPGRDAKRLADPTGRRLLLVVTDGASTGWSSPVYHDLFAHWAKTSPVGILSLVAPRLWPEHGLRATYRTVRSSTAWLPNARWHATCGPAGSPIPVANLSPARLTPFAAAFARPGADGAVLTLDTWTVPPRRHRIAMKPSPSPSPTAAVRRARRTLRPSAFWLLVGLSAAPLVPGPLLDRATSMIWPDATVDDLAALFQSELMEPCVVPDQWNHERVLAYRFRSDQVREELAGWLDPMDRKLLRVNLASFGRRVLGLSELDMNRLLEKANDPETLLRMGTSGDGSGTTTSSRPISDVDRKIRATPRRHRIIEATLRDRRIENVYRIATTLATEHLLDDPEPTIVSAAELLDPLRRRSLLSSAGRLVAVDDLDALHDQREPRRRRALDDLLRSMAGDTGAVIALCGGRGQVRPLHEMKPELRDFADTLRIQSKLADDIFTLVKGKLQAGRIRWSETQRRDVWIALCSRYPGDERPDVDIVDLARIESNRLIERWQFRSGGDIAVPLNAQDLLVLTETDVPS
jgi:hypothetical protein